MKSGFYDVFVGELQYEEIEVTAGTGYASIAGPLWVGAGPIVDGVYRVVFLFGGIAGYHVATPNDDGSLSVQAFFDGTPEPVNLTWKRES